MGHPQCGDAVEIKTQNDGPARHLYVHPIAHLGSYPLTPTRVHLGRGVALLWAFTTVPFFFVYDRTCTVLGRLFALGLAWRVL